MLLGRQGTMMNSKIWWPVHASNLSRESYMSETFGRVRGASSLSFQYPYDVVFRGWCVLSFTSCSREEINSLGKTKKGWANARHQNGSSSSSSSLGGKKKTQGTSSDLSTPAGRPQSCMEFERDWRRCKGDGQRRLR